MFEIIDIIGGALVLILIVVSVLYRKRARVLDKRYFTRRWSRLQKQCSNRKLWYQAIIDADELLDDALKKRHFKGKTTGERLVSAQHHFSANDSVWLSHKLKNKLVENDNPRKLKKKETMEALGAFRLALKDLEALGAERKTMTNEK